MATESLRQRQASLCSSAEGKACRQGHQQCPLQSPPLSFGRFQQCLDSHSSTVGLREQISSAGTLGAELDWGSGFTLNHITLGRKMDFWELPFSHLQNGCNSTLWVIVRTEQIVHIKLLA